MKKTSYKWLMLVLVLFTLTAAQQMEAQLKLPRLSPPVSVKSTIGVTDVTIDYSSPAVRNRQVWGKLVPYGLTKFGFGPGNPAPWRAGANENTVITFSTDVKIQGKDLAKGSYGLHMIPSEKEWVIIFSKNHTSWGSFFYDEKEDALRVTVTPRKAAFQEWLSYGFDSFRLTSANAYLQWEKLKVFFKIEVDSEKLVMQSIKNQLRSTAGFSWQGPYQAGLYCLRFRKDLDQGVKWIKQSIAMNENTQNTNTLGYILVANGKTEEALKAFREGIKKFPKDWNLCDSLAENLVIAGKKKEGIKYYKLALKKKPPEAQVKRIQDTLKKLQGK